ncbi:MAG TPA: hypothetical protein VN969_10010 [Streptosporangiaceae bacterium]|jgi:hypothetical protein|nr:hypothetical protein [Streptosporangiaceae bacterium]
MSEDGTGRTAAGTSTGEGHAGLLDVSGLTFDELSAMVGAADLGHALDYVLASGDNSSGYHGFNSRI